MREVTDEALQRLYWACRSRSDFPGDPPDESNGPPSTAAILHALGLMRPSLDDMGDPENLQTQLIPSGSSPQSRPQRMTPSSAAASLTQDECLPSPTQSSFSMSSVAQTPKSTPSLINTSNNSAIPATPPEMDMSEQPLYAASEPYSSHANSTSNGAAYINMENASNMTFDLDTYLDTSSCTVSPSGTTTYPVHNMHTTHQYDMMAMMERTGIVHPGDRASLPISPFVDGYDSPWPGSLAATNSTTDRNISLIT